MKAHVQNPWTRSPSLMVNMSVEHVQYPLDALLTLKDGARLRELDANQYDSLGNLCRELRHALNTPLPRGLKGVEP